LLHLSVGVIPLTSLGLDGHFGNSNALQMARQSHLQLLSKRRYDAALYCPYTGSSAGRGPHRKDGAKVDDDHLPMPYLKETTVAGHIPTCVYQAQLLHKEFPPPLHVVILAKTNRHTQARAHVVLFSRDLDLAYAPLVD
jgi:putative transposase